MSAGDELFFMPLGGCGEVGMNLYLYGIGPRGKEKWIIVDTGVKFADEADPGIDLMMPDVDFIRRRRKNLLGIVLTHGHEDHIGAIGHLWPQLQCPVYATPFTAELLKDKIAEAGIAEAMPLEVIPLGGRFELGPFDLEYISMNHSIPEPNAIAIRTELGTLLHTGDWKLDPHPVLGSGTDEQALRKLGAEGVLCMICDSTNVLSPGTAGSETLVRDALIDLVGQQKGRVAVTTFASNAARLDSIGRAAKASGRELVLLGRSMHRIVNAAKATGYLADFPTVLPEEEAGYLPRDKVLYLCTGSQGEPRAALARVAADDHPHLALGEGDTVIFSSKIIPGNEQPIFTMQNRLAERGVHVISEKDHFVHVSGHPCRDDLAHMYDWVRPRIVVPMHGETRMLLEHHDFAKAHGAKEAVVAVNGTLVKLAPGPAAVVEEIEAGRTLLDGNVLTDGSSPALSMRRRMSFNGAVVVTLIFGASGELLDDPRVIALGVPDELADLDDTIEGDLSIRIDEAVERLGRKACLDDGTVDETVRKTVRRVMRYGWGKRPPIEVDIVRLPD